MHKLNFKYYDDKANTRSVMKNKFLSGRTPSVILNEIAIFYLSETIQRWNTNKKSLVLQKTTKFFTNKQCSGYAVCYEVLNDTCSLSELAVSEPDWTSLKITHAHNKMNNRLETWMKWRWVYAIKYHINC